MGGKLSKYIRVELSQLQLPWKRELEFRYNLPIFCRNLTFIKTFDSTKYHLKRAYLNGIKFSRETFSGKKKIFATNKSIFRELIFAHWVFFRQKSPGEGWADLNIATSIIQLYRNYGSNKNSWKSIKDITFYFYISSFFLQLYQVHCSHLRGHWVI